MIEVHCVLLLYEEMYVSPCLDVNLVTVFRYSEILFHINIETCLLVVPFCLFPNVVITWPLPQKTRQEIT